MYIYKVCGKCSSMSQGHEVMSKVTRSTIKMLFQIAFQKEKTDQLSTLLNISYIMQTKHV